MLRIPYKKLTRSTDLSQLDLVRNILAILDKQGYNVIDRNAKSVRFSDNIWRFGSRNDIYRRVDGGMFEISSETENIVFSFYISARFEILVTLSVAFIAFTQDGALATFIIFIWVMFIVRVLSVKSAGIRMLESVVNQ